MYKKVDEEMAVSIRKFGYEDIPTKIRWINDSENNRYLHYDLPLEVEKTQLWFEEHNMKTDRYDAIIEVDGLAVGLIGLLSIDNKNKKAEYYITIGESQYKGRGIAKKASELLIDYAFDALGLCRIYLYTEADNVAAQSSFERIGFRQEGLIRHDLYSHEAFVDRFIYGLTKDEWKLANVGRTIPCASKAQRHNTLPTPITYLFTENSNRYYIKRDDLIPFSFGGNKVRKAMLFFNEFDNGHYDCIVTYGSSSSNHCRVVANMAAQRKADCYIISPEDEVKDTFNRQMMCLFGAQIISCPVESVHDTIEARLDELRAAGRKPFFIPGGGHGVTGTKAYVECYREIRKQECELDVHFDYVFFASGTGTTQAGLVCGKLIAGDEREIIGISIARVNPHGRQVVIDSVKEYLNEVVSYKNALSDKVIDRAVSFIDSYVGEGYGHVSNEVKTTIAEVLTKYGIPLDSTYTGKAFWGMRKNTEEIGIKDKNILFIHTGGTPLFFDDIRVIDVNA